MVDLKGYHEAIAYIDSFITGPAESGRGLEERAREWGARMARMAHFMALLGNPHQQFRSVHVGGTCGKGSTCAFIAAILQAAGYRVGLHTTPYLQTPIEKLEIDNAYAAPQAVAELVEWAKPYVARANAESPHGRVAYGQLWVGLTLAYFAQQRVDVGVIEVGVGGRYDYTNIIQPAAAAITNVELDHLLSLGPTIPDIARHKAGIVKPGIPVVTGAHQPEALAVIEQECQERGASLRRLGQEVHYRVREATQAGGVFDYRSDIGALDNLEIALLGEHQMANAALAVALAETLDGSGIAVPERAVREGLRAARLPGRLEIVQREPTVVLDGAHNPEKARCLAVALRQLWPHRRLILVLGVLASKDIKDILMELVPSADLVIATAPQVIGKPATPPEELARAVQRFGIAANVEPDPLKAIEQAISCAQADDLVCVTGSLYLVGAVRERWFPTEKILQNAATRPPVASAQEVP